MCFGSQKTQQQQGTQVQNVNNTTTSTPAPWLTSAAAGNVDYATALRNAGFKDYGGQFVSPFSGQQQASFGLGDSIAGAVTPDLQLAGGALAKYTTAGPQTVNPNTISSMMSPYMQQYVMQALAPQLEAQNQQFAGQNKSFDSAATGAGAFGDTGWGLGRSNLTTQQDIARTGLIGQAYNNAFNTAIGAGAQDVANNLAGQTTNANFAETALGRQLGGTNAIMANAVTGANLQNTMGGQQTAAGQADLNARYNQYLMSLQYPFQTAGLVNQTIGAAQGASPTTKTTTGTSIGNTDSTTYAPNNAGYGLLGSAIGAMPGLIGSSGGLMSGSSGLLGAAAMFSDPKLKENIEPVGKLLDDTPVYSYNFKADPLKRTMIGLMSTDVAKTSPEAVDTSGPFDKVDYGLATRRSAIMAKLADQLGIAA